MNLYIFHYHLNPGGVTRIIESQVEGLKNSDSINSITVITGGCEDRSFFDRKNVNIVVDDAFNYLTDSEDIESKYNYIKKRLREICSTDGILHFHNLNLGKNPILTLVVSEMASEGFSVINHAHDFAEDRPTNYKFIEEVFNKLSSKPISEILYPQVSNYHIATLNSHDLHRVKGKYVPDDHCHLLPNPVVFHESSKNYDPIKDRLEICTELDLDAHKLNIVYPVRVIRRKNIGEFILLAILFGDRANWIVTQPPKNPVEIAYYESWKEFCSKSGIKISWEAGQKVDFEKLIRSADACITTSIQEGFGMVYMEPWLLNTPVIGRDIQMVTEDLKSSGVEFPLLYDKLLIIDNKELHELNPEAQMNVLNEYINDRAKQRNIFKQNTFLHNLLNLPAEALIKRNKEVILKEFSLAKYTVRLNEIYRIFN